MRKLMRSVARKNMERAGIRKINRRFSYMWRNYVW